MTKTLSLSRGWGSPWDGFSACLKWEKYQYTYRHIYIYIYQPKAYVNCWCMYLSAMQGLKPHRNMSRMAMFLGLIDVYDVQARTSSAARYATSVTHLSCQRLDFSNFQTSNSNPTTVSESAAGLGAGNYHTWKNKVKCRVQMNTSRCK